MASSKKLQKAVDNDCLSCGDVNPESGFVRVPVHGNEEASFIVPVCQRCWDSVFPPTED
jgi:hypothetical protein